MLHVLTVADSVERCRYLTETAAQCGVDVQVAHVPVWRGYTDKIYAMASVLDFIPDDDVVLFVDAYDVLCMAGSEEILDKFRGYGCDLVLSSELNCYPAENAAEYDRVQRDMALPTRYRYVNSGGYIGYAWAVRHMLCWKPAWEMEAISALGGDQNYVSQYYLTFARPQDVIDGRIPLIRMDCAQLLFQSLYKVHLSCLVFLQGRVYNHILKSYPCFVHFNGSRDYNEEVIYCGPDAFNKDCDKETWVPAMPLFIRKMNESREFGNAGMDYRWPACGVSGGMLPQI
uniref:PLOD1-3-like GT domain-containing protein n=1 Tax=viral metagenome TaxID=1070528 RepID=A0A6C0EMJ8_9ZZZZ